MPSNVSNANPINFERQKKKQKLMRERLFMAAITYVITETNSFFNQEYLLL